ncbi:3-hydroxyisobutyryl-CoA hydrolase-like protein 5 [Brassica napus]|uniref:3-hydroxyisobutyryl-CoA hydrolase-like protein 5 n=1 Tax=Brassica napus TaxID=3708 RepID=UPI002079BA0F|nr:3-hydroxyisobutyryl-CoA hydrolase-like protein 5 [Brassica napus]
MAQEAQDIDEQVVVGEQKGSVRWATLDRTRQLNVLMHAEDLETWEKDDNAKLIVINGFGRRSFPADELKMFYDDQYSGLKNVYRMYWLCYHIHTYKKTQVSLVLAMTLGGGGAPLMLPAKFSVVTEYTDFATPEANFGFHIECGFSYIHSRLPGHLGEFLALTGAILNGKEIVAIGMATHFVPRAKVWDLTYGSLLVSFVYRYAKLGIKHWGVRALTIAKDNCPRWNPATLDEVDDEKIKLVFKPLEDDLELRIPETEENRWEGKAETSGFASVRG